MASAHAAGLPFAQVLIDAVVAGCTQAFEDEGMGAELPVLHRLFLDKMAATLSAPGATERRVLTAASGVGPAADGGRAAADDDDRAADVAGPVDRLLHPSGIVPRVDNVMAHANLGCQVELAQVARGALNVVYVPTRHAALSMYFLRPKGAVQLYASGKLVCTGARSEADAGTIARKCAAIVKRLGCEGANLQAFKVTNMFASCELSFELRLSHLAQALGAEAEYNPERAPKLTWHRRAEPPVVFEISAKGHVGLSGTTREADFSTALEGAFPTLRAYALARDVAQPAAA